MSTEVHFWEHVNRNQTYLPILKESCPQYVLFNNSELATNELTLQPGFARNDNIRLYTTIDGS